MIENRKWRMIIRIGMIGFGLLMGWRIYSLAVAPGGVPYWDEAAHALKGLLIAEDIRQGDGASFIYDSYRQVYWPPLQSWFVGPALLVGSVSIVTARAVSLIMFLLAALFIYFAGLKMNRLWGEVIAVVATVLFLTNPAMVSYGAQVMLEIYGVLFVIAAFFFYFAITQNPEKLWPHFLLGVCIVGAYFAKSNYGILLFIAVFIAALIDVRFRLRQLLTRQTFYFLLPQIIIFALWFAYPPKLISTWQAMVNAPFGVQDPFTVEGFLFYPRALLTMAGSPWMLLVWIATFVVSFWYGRDKNIRFLLIFVSIQLILGQIHHTKVVRHHLLILPAIFLLTGYLLARSLNWGKGSIKFWLPRVATVALLVMSVMAFWLTYQPSIRKTDEALITYLDEIVRGSGPILLIGSTDMTYPSPPELDWILASEYDVLDVTHSGAAMHYEQARALQSMLNKVPVSGVPEAFSPILARSESPLGLRTLYLGLPVGTGYSSGTKGVESFLRYQNGAETLETAVVLSRVDIEGNYPESMIAPALENLGLEPVENQDFSKIKVTIYKTGD